jgi:putative transposase
MTWKPKRLTRQQLEERRLAGGRLLRKRRQTRTQIARRLGVSRAAVSQWAKRLRSGGLRRLRARKSPGRPSKLTPQQQHVLLRKLKRGARAAGFPTERWTLWRIGRLIEREFGVSYHPNYLNRLLNTLDWSIQVPQACAAERDDKAVEAWLQHDWPRIKKGTSKPSNHRVFR